uniref:Phenylalanine--tRNA ligase beta subunit n=1 Tax=Pasteuria ramosa TaxID=225322 RepID=A2ID50_9BACL|nr:PheT [Pasteuria ramosa]
MRVSYKWLAEYVDLKDTTPIALAEKLTLAGIEVEEIIAYQEIIQHVVVGYVQDVQPHPQADRLKICTVIIDKNDEPLNIVCGAKNVKKGQHVPVAKIGATLPGGIKIKKTSLRGITSYGMICSAKELGLPMDTSAEGGIMVLDEASSLGEDILQHLALLDTVLVLAPTANRTDILGIHGLAIEVGAILSREVYLPHLKPFPMLGSQHLEVTTEKKDLCAFYACQRLIDVKIQPTPMWIKNRLIMSGIRPHSLLVDITQLVFLETGYPMHIFDMHKINGNLQLHTTKNQTKFIDLHDQQKTLPLGSLVLSDDKQILALAGIIGGKAASIDHQTTDILLESACFPSFLLRQTARHLQYKTSSAMRFAKGGCTPVLAMKALTRAIQLLTELADANTTGPVVLLADSQISRNERVITLQQQHLTKTLGYELATSTVENILQRLRLTTNVQHGKYEIVVDDFRPDLQTEIDIIEEIVRIHGWHRVPKTFPTFIQQYKGLTLAQKQRRQVRSLLVHWGFQEACTYSLLSKKEILKWQDPKLQDNDKIMWSLTNPMSSEYNVLRTTLLPSLLSVAAHNWRHGHHVQRWFELARTYHKGPNNTAIEKWELVLLGVGNKMTALSHQHLPSPGNFYALKGILTSLADYLGMKFTYEQIRTHNFHPFRTSAIKQADGQEIMGYLGELRQNICQDYDLATNVSAAVLQWDNIQTHPALNIKPWAIFPCIRRDIALVADEDISHAQIIEVIKKNAGPLLVDVTLFDVFKAGNLASNHKSLAYALVFQSAERTLQDTELKEIINNLLNCLAKELGITLRD